MHPNALPNTSAASQLKCGLINCQSIRNKTIDINTLIVENCFDLLFVTETWLQERNPALVAEMTPSTHSFISNPRINRTGGGVGVFVRKNIKTIKVVKSPNFTTFEYITITLNTANRNISFVLLYRPPSSNRKRFITEFKSFLNDHLSTLENLVVLGDFNIWIEDEDNFYAKKFRTELDYLNMVNFVTEPTTRNTHILDLIISNKENNLVKDVIVEPDIDISDHKLIHFKLNVPRQQRSKIDLVFRSKRNFIASDFIDDGVTEFNCRVHLPCICNNGIMQSISHCLNCYTSTFNSIFSKLYDLTCPVIRKTIVQRTNTPWFCTEIKSAIISRRRAERAWRKFRTADLFQTYKTLRNRVVNLIKRKKQLFYSEIIANSNYDPKRLHRTLKTLMGKNTENSLPSNIEDIPLGENFGDFFLNKISGISEEFPPQNDTSIPPDTNETHFSSLPDLSIDQVDSLILKSRKTFNEADPFPISDVIDSSSFHKIRDIFHIIINKCRREGSFPNCEKTAFITPTLKKGLSNEKLDSFRPVSKTSWLSKLIESSYQIDLVEYVTSNALIPTFQSAYRKRHSTETALLKIQNDLLLNMDSGKCSLLILLDNSAAYDTVNHSLFISKLHNMGIGGNALHFISSYLENRDFRVVVNHTASSPRKLSCGLPQGSILSPLLFTLYTAHIADALDGLPVKYHYFADDLQLYIEVSNIPSSNDTILSVLNTVKSEMKNSHLKLNDRKTTLILIASEIRRRRHLTNFTSLNWNNTVIHFVDKAKNLGFILDKNLNLDHQIKDVVKTVNFFLYEFKCIKKYINQYSSMKLIHNFVFSKLDYCNSLYINLPNHLLSRLQVAQNNAARFLKNIGPRNRITPYSLSSTGCQSKQE